MVLTKEMNFAELKKSIDVMIQAGEKGTVQYFCDRTECDNDKEVEAAISMLQAEGRAQLLRTTIVHGPCGGAIYQGVYGKFKILVR